MMEASERERGEKCRQQGGETEQESCGTEASLRTSHALQWLAQGCATVWEDTPGQVSSCGPWARLASQPVSSTHFGSNNSFKEGFSMCRTMAEYFCSPAGAVSWQDEIDWGTKQRNRFFWPLNACAFVFFWQYLFHLETLWLVIQCLLIVSFNLKL